MADRFVFGLEKLLDIRVKKEEESIREFQEVTRQKKIVEDHLTSLKDDYEKHKGIKKGESVVYQKIKRNYLIALTQGIDQTEKELVDKSKQVDYKREIVKQKTVDRKTVELLKDKKFQAFKQEQDRVERVSNDEFALYSYFRNSERGWEISEY